MVKKSFNKSVIVYHFPFQDWKGGGELFKFLDLRLGREGYKQIHILKMSILEVSASNGIRALLTQCSESCNRFGVHLRPNQFNIVGKHFKLGIPFYLLCLISVVFFFV